MNVTITGASGTIGRRLIKAVGAANHSVGVLARNVRADMPAGVRLWEWDAMKGPPPPESLADADAVIHLAGEPVAQRWTNAAKERIRDSRVLGTRHLVEGLAALPRRPAVLISSSAVGYYGSRGDEVLTEHAPPGTGFLAEVCKAWEAEADRACEFGIRVAKIRTGVVLAKNGGALPKMLPLFRAYLGGTVGSGSQWMSWIHIEDLTALMLLALVHPLAGAVNGTAPHPATNAEFTRVLAATLGRPAMLPVPAFAVRLLMGEMTEVLLASQRVLPEAARRAGFTFRYPELDHALKNLLRA
ncbi:MAG TPA: TIGR01777 family oxidoreductase [Bryobacteraceae bacterium]|nr:TIGR01777 family oxidoreductase [Bryobacteraceae bacterium]